MNSVTMRTKSMLPVFLRMIESVGGSYTPCAEAMPANPKRQGYEASQLPVLRGLSGEHYTQDAQGTIRRRHPKRDKTVSARQWKKQRTGVSR